MSKITLTNEEKECLKSFVHHRGLTEYAFMKAAELAKLAERNLMNKVLELYPTATGLEHPPNEKWTVTTCDDIKKKKKKGA